ncbi:hypothetical protein HMPREF0673_01830, partial [Leyella stercorea DSM 18206]
GALVSSAPTEVVLCSSWLVGAVLDWFVQFLADLCASWLVGALETSAPPISAKHQLMPSASVGADIRIGRRRHPHRSTQTSASVDTRRRR